MSLADILYIAALIGIVLAALYVSSQVKDALDAKNERIQELKDKLAQIYNVGHNLDCLFCGFKDRLASEYTHKVIRMCSHCAHEIHSSVCITEWCKCGPWPQVED